MAILVEVGGAVENRLHPRADRVFRVQQGLILILPAMGT